MSALLDKMHAKLERLETEMAATFENDPRNETEAWQVMRLPPLPPEERAEYERGPSPWPAVLLITATLVVWALVICTAV